MRLLILLFALLMAAPALPRVAAPADTVHALIAGAPEGATITIPPGTYHVERLPIKAGQSLIAHGVTFTGGVVLADWTISGDYKYAEVDGLINSSAYADQCNADAPRCHQPNTLWHEDAHLLHATRLSDVTTADRYYIDYAAGRVWVRNDAPSTLVLNVRQSLVDTSAGGWSIVGATIQHYASKFQRGAVWSNGSSVTLDRVTVRRISGTGVKLGAGATITDSRFETVLQLGLGTTVPSGTLAPGVRVTQSVFIDNGNGGVRCDWEGGAIKLVRTVGAIVAHNYVGTNCKGIWFDIDNDAALIRYNLVEDNADHGIFWEISARALIECNVSRNNGTLWTYNGLGGSQIHISSAGPVQVRENLVVLEAHGNGVTLRGADRGVGIFPWISTGNLIQANTIVHMAPRGINGLHSRGNREALIQSEVNLFDGNAYYAPSGWAYWYTDVDGQQRKGGLEYAQDLGHEPNGTMLNAAPFVEDRLDYLNLSNWPDSACGAVRGAPAPTPTPTAVPTSTPAPTLALHPLYRLRIIIEVDGR